VNSAPASPAKPPPPPDPQRPNRLHDRAQSPPAASRSRWPPRTGQPLRTGRRPPPKDDACTRWPQCVRAPGRDSRRKLACRRSPQRRRPRTPSPRRARTGQRQQTRLRRPDISLTTTCTAARRAKAHCRRLASRYQPQHGVRAGVGVLGEVRTVLRRRDPKAPMTADGFVLSRRLDAASQGRGPAVTSMDNVVMGSRPATSSPSVTAAPRRSWRCSCRGRSTAEPDVRPNRRSALRRQQRCRGSGGWRSRTAHRR
jgi:hypothetical protein